MAGTLKYKSEKKHIDYGPVNTLHGYSNVRWVENVKYGLRSCGFADEILGLRHRGWFTRDDGDGDETYRGIVYQLPARAGKEQYVYGYADPDNEGCALLCFDVVHDKEDAARDADTFAETMADHARDYNRTWDAGQRYRDLGDAIKDARTKALSLGKEIREARKHFKHQPPTICAVLRSSFLQRYRNIQKMRKERAELLTTFGHHEGFTD